MTGRRRCEVAAVGGGKVLEDGTRQPPDVREGDRVLFGKYSGSEVKIDGGECLIMREDEILGVFTTTARSKAAGRRPAGTPNLYS